MAYNALLTERLRESLLALLGDDPRKVEEKRMFNGVAFMVDGKMTVTAGDESFMFRIDPALHHEAVEEDGVETVIMGGREYKGYVRIEADTLRTKKDLDRWLRLALNYNHFAKASKKKNTPAKRTSKKRAD